MADRLADERQRREVQDAVKPLRHRVADRRGVPQVGPHETGLGSHRGAMSSLEAVQHHDIVAGSEQLARDDRADVSGATGDQQLHGAHLLSTGAQGISRWPFNTPRIASAVTDQSDALHIAEFEHVAAGGSVTLLRVAGRVATGVQQPQPRPALQAEHPGGLDRFEPLPSPPDPAGVIRAAYSVPATLLAPGTTFRLELASGSLIELPAPVPGAARPPTAGGG